MVCTGTGYLYYGEGTVHLIIKVQNLQQLIYVCL